MYDLIVIGAGPAGLSAGLTAAYFRLKAAVLEATVAGGALTQTYPWKEPDSCIGMRGKKARDIAELMVRDVRAQGCKIREGEQALVVRPGKGSIAVKTGRGSYEARAVVLATGTIGTPKRLGIPGEDSGNVSYFVSDPKAYKGKSVLVVGGGDSAAQSALALHKAGARVCIAHRKGELRCMDEAKCEIDESRIRVLWCTELKAVKGKGLTLLDNRTGKTSEGKADHVFILVGSDMDWGFLKGIGVATEGEKVVVDKDMKTSVPGIFAAGDVTGGIKRIPQAIAQGETAVYSAYKYIKNPYWK
jgi:thioredoxin reductase (NADPH)